MSQPYECCRGNRGHYDYIPSAQHCCTLGTRQIESPPSSPCCHTHSHRPVPPNYCTSHDTAPSSPGSFCSCQPMNHVHSPNVHLQPSYGGSHSHSPAHHCGSYRHLPSVASPLHVSRVSASMAVSPMSTNPMPLHNSGFHTPTQHVHYNTANSPSQPLTPQMTSGFRSRRQLLPQAHNELHHPRPQSPDVCTPVSDYECSCPTTPTSYLGINSHRPPKPEMVLEFSPMSDTHMKASRTNCFEMGMNVSGNHSDVVPTPMVRGRSSAFVNVASMTNVSTAPDVDIQQQESTRFEKLKPNHQLHLYNSDTNAGVSSIHTSGNRVKKVSNPNTALIYPTLKETGETIRHIDSKPHVTPFSVHLKKIRTEGKGKAIPHVEDGCNGKEGPDETIPSTEVVPPNLQFSYNLVESSVASSSSVVEEHDVIEVDGTDDDNDTEAQSMDVCTQLIEPTSTQEDEKPNVATTSTDLQDSQQPTQKEHPEDFTVKTECSSQGSSKNDTFTDQPKKSVVLHQWSFTLLPGGSVILYGLRDQGSNNKWWHSGPVSERVSSSLLLTKSGTVYHLMGTINTKEMNKSAVWSTVTGKKVLKKFKSGFPSGWELLLQELNVDAEHTPEEKPRFLEQSTPSVSLKSVKSEPQDTPTIDSSFLSSLKRSSRGRVIKPTLNEHSASPFVYLYDMHGSFKGITSPVIDLTVDEDEDSEAPLSVGTEVKKEPKETEKEEPLPRKKAVKKEQLKSISCDTESDASSSFSQSIRQTKRKRSRRLVLHVKSKRKIINITEESSESVKMETVQRAEEQRENAVVSKSSELHPVVEHETKRKTNRKAAAPKAGEKLGSEIEVSTKNETLPRTVKHKSRGRGRGKQRLEEPPLVIETGPQMEQRNEGEAEPGEILQISQRTRSKSKKKVVVVEPLAHKDDANEERDGGAGMMNSEADSMPAGKRKTRKSRGKERAVPVNEEMESEKEECSVTVTKPKRNSNKRKTKRVSMEEPSSEATVLGKRLGNAQTEKGSHRTKRNEPAIAEQTKRRPTVSWSDELLEEESIKWTQPDIARLKRIVLNVPALTANFWEVVAQKLATGHTARECSSQYLQITAKSHKSEQASKEKKIQDGGLTAITAKEGTIKRKRQLRNALELMDAGYSDDIFDATPYKKKVRSVQIDLSDDECFNDLENDSDCDASYTPTEARRRVGAPSTHTPKLCDYLTTPDLKNGLKRDAADNVIYKIQKAKKVQRQPVKKKTSNVERKRSKGGKLLSLENLHRIRSGEQTTLRLIEDSDDSSSEDSDPFSDMEEEYQNIMKQLH